MMHTELRKMDIFWILLVAVTPEITRQTAARQLGSVLALFPLTGSENLRGRAQQAGVRIALDNMQIDEHVTLHQNDSQCDIKREGRLVVDALIYFRRLVVLGGGCMNTDAHMTQTHCDPNSVIHTYVPQVLFEENVQPEGDSAESEALFNVRSSATSAHSAIIAFIKRNQWQKVALVYTEYGIHNQGAQSFRAISQRSGIEVPLLINVQNTQIWRLLKSSRLKVVILHVDKSSLKQFICRVDSSSVSYLSRFTWLLPSLRDQYSINTERFRCNGHVLDNVFTFEVGTPIIYNQKFKEFSKTLVSKYPDLQDVNLRIDAAHAHDATQMVMTSLLRSNHSTDDNFVNTFAQEIKKIHLDSTTGVVKMESSGRRAVNITVHRFKNSDFTKIGSFQKQLVLVKNLTIPVSPNNISTTMNLEGIPLYTFIIMSAFSLVGIVFTIALLIFNIMKQKDRVIKMTSPNINVMILCGCILAYISVIILGQDSQLVGLSAMAKLHQAATYTITISFTLVYGSTFAKSWRVYIIFNNLQFNGKTTRDEHLILVVLLLVLIDLVLLLSWTFADPFICTRFTAAEAYQAASDSDLIYQTDVCTCRLFPLWLCLMYLFKSLILSAGFYFTWQTRHVTLPALKDTQFIYVIIYSVVTLSMVLLPIMLISSVAVHVKYIVGSMVIIILTTVTMCLLFVPKVQLYRKNRCKETSNLVQFLFSESMRKTQETKKESCFGNCFSFKEDDPYAQEVFATEIENLKKTIKEKDASIRELTDRLFFGTEKFQEYLRTPKHHLRSTPTRHHTPSSAARYQRGYHSDPDTPEIYRRTRPVSYTASSHLSQTSNNATTLWNTPRASELPIKEPVRSNLARPLTPLNTQVPQIHQNRINFRKDKRPSSPNHDSAIDNSSPSSISSDKEFPDIIEQPDFEMDVFEDGTPERRDAGRSRQFPKEPRIKTHSPNLVKNVHCGSHRSNNFCFSEI